MFDEFSVVKKLKDATHILAEKKDWPPLYNTSALNNNKVCCLGSKDSFGIQAKFNSMNSKIK